LLLKKAGIETVAPSIFHGQAIEASVQDLVQFRLLRPVRAQLLKASGKVIVVLDREERGKSASDFSKTLCAEFGSTSKEG